MFWVTEKPPIKNILYGDLVDGLSEQSEDMSAGQKWIFTGRLLRAKNSVVFVAQKRPRILFP